MFDFSFPELMVLWWWRSRYRAGTLAESSAHSGPFVGTAQRYINTVKSESNAEY